MEVNVKEMQLVRSWVPAREKDPIREVLIVRIRDDDDNWQSPYIHGTELIRQFRDSLFGAVPWYDKPALDDVSYIIHGMGPWGFDLWKREGDKINEYNYRFPGEIVAEWLEYHQVSSHRKELRVTWDEEFWKKQKFKFAPRARLEFASDEARARYDAVRAQEDPLYTDEVVEKFEQEIEGWLQTARNFSRADIPVVSLSTDFMDHSFYVTVSKTVKHSCGRCNKRLQLYNGGIIAHPERNDDNEVIAISYSTHT